MHTDRRGALRGKGASRAKGALRGKGASRAKGALHATVVSGSMGNDGGGE